MYDYYGDERNGSRARSSRIRSSHDLEATTLDTMRRRSGEQAERRSWIIRFAHLCRRPLGVRTRRAQRPLARS
jgi:hypothetical protein